MGCVHSERLSCLNMFVSVCSYTCSLAFMSPRPEHTLDTDVKRMHQVRLLSPFSFLGEAVSESQAPAEKQPSLHPGHPAGHVPAPADDPVQIRGEPETGAAERERLL